jgi:hypothetical protein
VCSWVMLDAASMQLLIWAMAVHAPRAGVPSRDHRSHALVTFQLQLDCCTRVSARLPRIAHIDFPCTNHRCRWVQHECRALSEVDAPEVNPLLQQAAVALRERPVSCGQSCCRLPSAFALMSVPGGVGSCAPTAVLRLMRHCTCKRNQAAAQLSYKTGML